MKIATNILCLLAPRRDLLTAQAQSELNLPDVSQKAAR